MEIYDDIDSLLGQMRKRKQDRLRYMQYPAAKDEVDMLFRIIKHKYGMELSPVYKCILLATNGFRENGVVLYGTETRLLEGYKEDMYVEGFQEANENWKHNIDFANHIVYAESDTYIFAQSTLTNLYSCHTQGDFEESLLWETPNDNFFFETVLKLAVDNEFYIQDVLK